MSPNACIEPQVSHFSFTGQLQHLSLGQSPPGSHRQQFVSHQGGQVPCGQGRVNATPHGHVSRPNYATHSSHAVPLRYGSLPGTYYTMNSIPAALPNPGKPDQNAAPRMHGSSTHSHPSQILHSGRGISQGFGHPCPSPQGFGLPAVPSLAQIIAPPVQPNISQGLGPASVSGLSQAPQGYIITPVHSPARGIGSQEFGVLPLHKPAQGIAPQGLTITPAHTPAQGVNAQEFGVSPEARNANEDCNLTGFGMESLFSRICVHD